MQLEVSTHVLKWPREVIRLLVNGRTLDHDILRRTIELVAHLRALSRPTHTLRRWRGVGRGDWQSAFNGFPSWPEDVSAVLSRLPDGFVTSYSMRPDAVHWLFNRILALRPKLLVEAGCGISTVVFATAAKRLEAQGTPMRFVSLEPEKQWKEVTDVALDEAGVSTHVDVRHAPLVDFQWQERPYRAFDPNAWNDLHDIEVLVIDSPPGTIGRGGVLPQLEDRVARGALITLDDASRDGERDAAQAWDRAGLATLTGFVPFGRGIAVLRRS